ncbi:hypothetical protein CDD83_5590 [Cordyceps sp. RAO-2017]|nr:hypothetical protein CDD83_5590 [Cordyceps sp. RAO-2017]
MADGIEDAAWTVVAAPPIELYIGLSAWRDAQLERHWLLVARAYGARTATWIHAANRPELSITNLSQYLDVSPGHAFDSPDVTDLHLIARLDASCAYDLRAAADAVPLCNSRDWVLRVLEWLEAAGVIALGLARLWLRHIDRLERRLDADDDDESDAN